MKRIDKGFLSLHQSQALDELKHRLEEELNIEAIFLYGSVVRGEADDESDIDLLILTSERLNRFSRHEITDIAFDINLKYGTNFSSFIGAQRLP